MKRCGSQVRMALLSALLAVAAAPTVAQSKADCSALPDAGRLRSIVQSVVREGAAKNGGMGNQEWAAVVNRDGIVCAIVFSRTTRGRMAGESGDCRGKSEHRERPERAGLRSVDRDADA